MQEWAGTGRRGKTSRVVALHDGRLYDAIGYAAAGREEEENTFLGIIARKHAVLQGRSGPGAGRIGPAQLRNPRFFCFRDSFP